MPVAGGQVLAALVGVDDPAVREQLQGLNQRRVDQTAALSGRQLEAQNLPGRQPHTDRQIKASQMSEVFHQDLFIGREQVGRRGGQFAFRRPAPSPLG